MLHTNTYHDDTGGGEDTSQCYGTYERGSPLRSKHLPRAFLFGPGLLPGTSSFASELGLRWDDAFGGVPGGRVRAVAVHAPGAGDVAELEKLVIISVKIKLAKQLELGVVFCPTGFLAAPGPQG